MEREVGFNVFVIVFSFFDEVQSVIVRELNGAVNVAKTVKMKFGVFSFAFSVNTVSIVEISFFPAVIASVTVVVQVVLLRESVRADVVLFHSSFSFDKFSLLGLTFGEAFASLFRISSSCFLFTLSNQCHAASYVDG